MSVLNNSDYMTKMKKNFDNYKWYYIICIISICLGIFIGTNSCKCMNNNDRDNIISIISNSLVNPISEEISFNYLFMENLKSYLPIVIALWFLGLTIAGIPLIILINIYKGYTLGFTSFLMINLFSIKETWMIILSIILQNIILIPCIVIFSVLSMNFSIGIINDKMIKYKTKGLLSQISTYTFSFLLVFCCMAAGFLLQAAISPLAIGIFTKNFAVI